MKISEPHIIFLDLYHRGHHLSYLEMLYTQWRSRDRHTRLTLLVGKAFIDTYPKFVRRVNETPGGGAQCVLLEKTPSLSGGSVGIWGLIKADRAHRLALIEALSLNPDYIVCMFFDHAQRAVASLAPLLRKSGVSVTGIFFRPTLHEAVFSTKQRINAWRKRFVLNSALKSPALKKLYCLDPDAVSPINSLAGRQVATWLPDGTSISAADLDARQFRSSRDIDDSDTVFLLFGTLSRRKGVFKVLSAFSELPNTAALILAGRPAPGEETEIMKAVDAARKTARVILITEYIADSRMTTLFQASDVVLVAYQWHTGSSGILIRAAAARKPVIGSDHGMVGRNIEAYRLGLALDSTDSEMLYSAMKSALFEPVPNFDPASASDFAAANSVAEFSETIMAGVMT